MALFINGVGQDTFNVNGVSIDNLYVDNVLVWTRVANIPRYELTEVLVDASTVNDSANTSSNYNGLLTESDGTTPYEPTALQYPQNGLLALENGRVMDTQYIMNTQEAVYGIYGADGSTVYNIYALEPVSEGIVNVWEGNQDTIMSKTYSSVAMSLPIESWKVTEGRPEWMPSPSPLISPIYISYFDAWTGTEQPAPEGVTINTFSHDIDGADTSTTHTLNTINNDISNVTMKLVTTFDRGYDGKDDGTGNTLCMTDNQASSAWRNALASAKSIDFYLPEGNWSVEVGCFKDNVLTNGTGDYTMNGETLSLDSSNNSVARCGTFTTITSTGEIFRLDIVKASGQAYAYLSGINITEVK